MTDAFGISNVPNDKKKTVFGLEPLLASQWTEGGNSYLARRARVAEQRRDKRGRWAIEGGFISFELRNADGTFSRQIGRYTGAARGERMMRVVVTEPRDNAPAGLYFIDGRNATFAKAFLSTDDLAVAGVDVNGARVGSTLDRDIPNLADAYQGPADAVDNEILTGGLSEEEKSLGESQRNFQDAERPHRSYNVVDDEGNRVDDPAEAEDPFPGEITEDSTTLSDEQYVWALRNVSSHYRIPRGGRFPGSTEEDVRSDLATLRSERDRLVNSGVNTSESDDRIAWAEEELYAQGSMAPEEERAFLLARSKDINGIQAIRRAPVVTEPAAPSPDGGDGGDGGGPTPPDGGGGPPDGPTPPDGGGPPDEPTDPFQSLESEIDVDALTESQRATLNNLISWKNKAIEARSNSALDDDTENFEQQTALVERAISSINGIAIAQRRGDAGKAAVFSGAEAARFENMRIIPSSVVMGLVRANDSTEGKPGVVQVSAITVAKNGQPFLIEFKQSRVEIFPFDENGKVDRRITASSVGNTGSPITGGSTEYGRFQREPHHPLSTSVGGIGTREDYQNIGLAGYVTLISRWASEMSGRGHTHSNHLLTPGNYYSKKVSPRLEGQHRSQWDKSIDVNNPNAEIIRVLRAAKASGILTFPESFFNRLITNNGGFVQGSGANLSPLWGSTGHHDASGPGRSLVKLIEDIRLSYRRNGRNGQVGVDFPEFATDSVTGENENWDNYDIQTYLLRTSYLGGPSKEEAVAYLTRIVDGLQSISSHPDHGRKASTLAGQLKNLRDLIAKPEYTFDDSTRTPEPEKFDPNKALTWSSPYAGSSEFSNFLIPSGYPKVPVGNFFIAKPAEPNPIQLATDHDEQTLVSILREAVVGRKSNVALIPGSGLFPESTSVQTGAIYKALEEKGLDAPSILAGIYDEALGDGRDDNRQRLDATRTQLRDIRSDMREITRELDQQVDPVPFQDLTGNYDPATRTVTADTQERRDDDSALPDPNSRIQELKKNDLLVVNGQTISQDEYRPTRPTRSWIISGVTDNPRIIARNFATEPLQQAFTNALERGEPRITLGFARGGTLDVPIEAIRDALQHQGASIDQLVDSLPFRDSLRPSRFSLSLISNESLSPGVDVTLYALGGNNGRQRVSVTVNSVDGEAEISMLDGNNPGSQAPLGEITRLLDGKFKVSYTKPDGTQGTEIYDDRDLAGAALNVALSRENSFGGYMPALTTAYGGMTAINRLADLDSELHSEVETVSDPDGTARIFRTINMNSSRRMRVEEDSTTGTILWRDPEDTSGNFASVTPGTDADGNEFFTAESPAFKVRFANRDAAIEMADGYAARKIFTLKASEGFIAEPDADGRRSANVRLDVHGEFLSLNLPDDYEEAVDGDVTTRTFRNVKLANGAIVTVKTSLNTGSRVGDNSFSVRNIQMLDENDNEIMGMKISRTGPRSYAYRITNPVFNREIDGFTGGFGGADRLYGNSYTSTGTGAENEERATDGLRRTLSSRGASPRDIAQLLQEPLPEPVPEPEPVADVTPVTAPTVSSNPQEIRQNENLLAVPIDEARMAAVLNRMAPIDLTGADFGGRIATRGITEPTLVILPDGRRFKMKKWDEDPAGFQRVAENEAAAHAMLDILGIPATSGGLGRMPDGSIVLLDPFEPNVIDMSGRSWFNPPSSGVYDRVRQDNALNKIGMVLLGATDHDPTGNNPSNVFYTRDSDGTIRSRICDGGGFLLFAAGSFTRGQSDNPRLKDNHIFPGTRRYGNNNYSVDGLLRKTGLDTMDQDELRSFVAERVLPMTPDLISTWASTMYSNPDDISRATDTLISRRSELLAQLGISDTAPAATRATPATPATQPGGSGGGTPIDPNTPSGASSSDESPPLGSDGTPIYSSWTIQELPNGTRLAVGVRSNGDIDLRKNGVVVGTIRTRYSGDTVVTSSHTGYVAVFDSSVSPSNDIQTMAQKYLSQLAFAAYDIDNMQRSRRNLFSDDQSIISDEELVGRPIRSVFMGIYAMDSDSDERDNARQSLERIDRSAITPEQFLRFERIIDGFPFACKGEIYEITELLDGLPQAPTPTPNPTPSTPSTDTPAPSAPSSVNTPVTPNVDGSTTVSSLRVGDYMSGVGRVIMLRNDPDSGKTYLGVLSENGSTQFLTRNSDETFFINNADPDASRITDITGGTNRITGLHDAGNITLNDVISAYPDAVQLPNGDILISQREFKYANRGGVVGKTYRFEVVVHRTGTEEFSSYARMIEIDPTTREAIPGVPTMASGATALAHSSQALLNRIPEVLRGINRPHPGNWFNNQGDKSAEVIDPRTGAPIHPDLLPRTFDEEIGTTGIQRTGDGMRDALIEYITDLIDNNAADADIMLRLTESGFLSQNQVLDVIERYEAHLRRPGVNSIPYVSRDKENIIRVGDIVHHHNRSTGEIDREGGRVVSRVPIKVYNKTSGTYEYADLLEVLFPGDNRGRPRQLVSRNLSLVQRADGSPIEPLRTGDRPVSDPTPSNPPTGPTPDPDVTPATTPTPPTSNELSNDEIVARLPDGYRHRTNGDNLIFHGDNDKPAVVFNGVGELFFYKKYQDFIDAGPSAAERKTEGNFRGEATENAIIEYINNSRLPDSPPPPPPPPPGAPAAPAAPAVPLSTTPLSRSRVLEIAGEYTLGDGYRVNVQPSFEDNGTYYDYLPVDPETLRTIRGISGRVHVDDNGNLRIRAWDAQDTPVVNEPFTGTHEEALRAMIARVNEQLGIDTNPIGSTTTPSAPRNATEDFDMPDNYEEIAPGMSSIIITGSPIGGRLPYTGISTPDVDGTEWTMRVEGPDGNFTVETINADSREEALRQLQNRLNIRLNRDGVGRTYPDDNQGGDGGNGGTPPSSPSAPPSGGGNSATPTDQNQLNTAVWEEEAGVAPDLEDPDGDGFSYGIIRRVQPGGNIIEYGQSPDSRDFYVRVEDDEGNEILLDDRYSTLDEVRRLAVQFANLMPSNYHEIYSNDPAQNIRGVKTTNIPGTPYGAYAVRDASLIRFFDRDGNLLRSTANDLDNEVDLRGFIKDELDKYNNQGGGNDDDDFDVVVTVNDDGTVTTSDTQPTGSRGGTAIGQLPDLPSGYVMDNTNPGAYRIYRSEDPSSAPEVRITPMTDPRGMPGFEVEYFEGGSPVSTRTSLDEIGQTLANAREAIASRYNDWRERQIQEAVDGGTPRFMAMLPSRHQAGVVNNPDNLAIRVAGTDTPGGRTKKTDDGRWKTHFFENGQGMVSSDLLAQHPVTEEQTFDTKEEAAEWLASKIHDSYTRYLNANYPDRLPENYVEDVLSSDAVLFSSSENDKPRVEVRRTASGEWQVSAWGSNSDAENGASPYTSMASDYSTARSRALDFSRSPSLVASHLRSQDARNSAGGAQRIRQTTFDSIAANDAFWEERTPAELIRPIPHSSGNFEAGAIGVVHDTHGDVELWNILVSQGMNERPQVVQSANDFQGTKIGRGIGQSNRPLDVTRAQANQLAFSDAPYFGYGIYGNGVYSGTDIRGIRSFYANKPTSSFVQMSVLPEARILEVDAPGGGRGGSMRKAEELLGELITKLMEVRGLSNAEAKNLVHERYPWLVSANGNITTTQFLGHLAAMLGYDGIRAIGAGAAFGVSGDTYVILNRGVLQVLDNGFSPND